MYSIYYIPNFVWKHTDVKGKIGVSEEPEVRVKRQGYSHYEVLETHDDIDVVSKRERELQKEYGLPVDTVPYWQSRKKWGSYAGKKGGDKCRDENIGFFAASKEQRSEWNKKAFSKRTKKSLRESGKRAYELRAGVHGLSKQERHINAKKAGAITLKKYGKKVNQYDLEGNFIESYPSIKNASENTSCSRSSIANCCNGKYKTSKGFIWKYKD